jgi:hypothetical protein
MTGKKALWARPVCDPELAESLRLLVMQPPGAQNRAGSQGGRRVRQWLRYRELARHSEQVIFPDTLHHDSRRLLARAQNAIDAILSSQVRAVGLLVADEPVLRRHEWEIACALRELTRLRALSASTADAGALTAAVLDAQRQALGIAADATDSRVSALERYAEQVEAADAAHRDWESALHLAGLNDRYLDLVARTAADELAVIELGELTGRASVATAVLTASLHDASVAADILVLPPPKAS